MLPRCAHSQVGRVIVLVSVTLERSGSPFPGLSHSGVSQEPFPLLPGCRRPRGDAQLWGMVEPGASPVTQAVLWHGREAQLHCVRTLTFVIVASPDMPTSPGASVMLAVSEQFAEQEQERLRMDQPRVSSMGLSSAPVLTSHHPSSLATSKAGTWLPGPPPQRSRPCCWWEVRAEFHVITGFLAQSHPLSGEHFSKKRRRYPVYLPSSLC